MLSESARRVLDTVSMRVPCLAATTLLALASGCPADTQAEPAENLAALKASFQLRYSDSPDPSLVLDIYARPIDGEYTDCPRLPSYVYATIDDEHYGKIDPGGILTGEEWSADSTCIQPSATWMRAPTLDAPMTVVVADQWTEWKMVVDWSSRALLECTAADGCLF